MLVWIVSMISAAFILQLILVSPKFSATSEFVWNLSLSLSALQDWHIWVLATHSLLHDVTAPWNVLFTLLGLIFAGRELEPLLGSQRFLALFIGSIVFSALCWCAVHLGTGGFHIGATAAVFAFLVVLAGINADTESTLLFLPARFRLVHLVALLAVVEALALFFYELPTGKAPLGLSPSTHLGGMFAGWIYFRFLHAGNGWDRAPTSFSLSAWLKPAMGKQPVSAPPATDRPRRGVEDLRADVDRILDKINSHGFGSLTEEEKRTLDDAKDLLSKR
jgi:membrane associated rhomboid family serine protease